VSPIDEPSQLLQVRHEPTGDAHGVVVHVVGEVDLSSGHILVDELAAVEKELQAPGPLVINLTDVTFFGTVGLNALVGSLQRCQSAGIDQWVVTGNDNVARPIAVIGLGETLTLFDTLEDALNTAP